MNRRFALVLVLMAAHACSSESSDGSGAGLVDAAGDGDGDGDSGACLDPLEQSIIVSPRDFSDGSVIYRVAVDGPELFFSTIDTIYSVSAAGGGEPEVLYHRDLAIGMPFWVRDDDLLVLDGADELVSVPKDGSDPTTLTTLPYLVSGALDTRVDFIVDGAKAYAKQESGGFGDQPLEITYFEVDLTTFETRELSVNAIGDGSIVVKSGDALYTASKDPSVMLPEDDIATFVPDRLHRIPIAGGAAELVDTGDLELAHNVLGSFDGQLFLIGTADGDLNASGVYRVSDQGGAAEQVLETIALFNLTFALHPTTDDAILVDLDTYYEVSATGAATELFCVGGGQYTTHGTAADDDFVFASLYDDDGKALIVRVPR